MSIARKPKPNLIQKIEKCLKESLYKSAIETSSTYNNRLIAERLNRLPFFDLQTGVAQNNCSLWMNRWERMPGSNQGQLYSYPSNRWHKSKRSYRFNEICTTTTTTTRNKSNLESGKNDLSPNGSEINLNSIINIKSENDDYNNDKSSDLIVIKDSSGLGETEESTVDMNNYLVGEGEDGDTEEEEDLNNGNNRKKRKKYAKRKKASEYTDAEKPYFCDFCGIKYKTRPGLAYHYSHSHPGAHIDMTIGPRNTSNGLDDNSTGEMNSKSEMLIPNQPGLSSQSSSFQGYMSNPFNRSTFFREKINSPTSNLTDQRSTAINCPTTTSTINDNNQPTGFGSFSSKYSPIGKSMASISNESDESSLELSNLSSNCRNLLWPLNDPLFSSA